MGVDGMDISWWRATYIWRDLYTPTGRRIPSDKANRPINFVNNILSSQRFAPGLLPGYFARLTFIAEGLPDTVGR